MIRIEREVTDLRKVVWGFFIRSSHPMEIGVLTYQIQVRSTKRHKWKIDQEWCPRRRRSITGQHPDLPEHPPLDEDLKSEVISALTKTIKFI